MSGETNCKCFKVRDVNTFNVLQKMVTGLGDLIAGDTFYKIKIKKERVY